MSSGYPQNQYQQDYTMGYSDPFAALASASERSAFIMRTYMNLAGAIFALILLEVILFHIPGIGGLAEMMFATPVSWIVVLGLFMGVSWIANSWALNATSPGKQYAGLGLYVFAESIILFPLLYVASIRAPGAIFTAAGTTLALFGIMTGVVFVTKKDFSFMRVFLIFGGFAALGFIVIAMLFGFNTIIFAYVMVAFACCYILYDTSNVMHHYHTSQHAAAALALFASIALLFWYVLRIVLAASRE